MGDRREDCRLLGVVEILVDGVVRGGEVTTEDRTPREIFLGRRAAA